MNLARPMTPLDTTQADSSAMAYISPLSDSFSDSPDLKDYAMMPSIDTRQLLKQLNDFTAQILHLDPPAHSILHLKHGLAALQRSLQPGNTPGIALDYDHVQSIDDDQLTSFHVPLSPDTDEFSDNESEDTDNHQVGLLPAALLKETQTLLERVTRANVDLTSRLREMRSLNDRLSDQLESSSREVLTLRSETETLRAELVHDHSELLFLQLQLRALEVEADESLDMHNDSPDHDQPLWDSIHRWKGDWEDVDVRLRSRRERHGIRLASSPVAASPLRGREDGKHDDDQGVWQLDVCKKRKGRVESIVIKRRLEEATNDQDLGNHDDDDENDVDDDPFEVQPHKPTLQVCGPRCVQASRDLQLSAEHDQDRPVGAWHEFYDSLVALAGMADR